MHVLDEVRKSCQGIENFRTRQESTFWTSGAKRIEVLTFQGKGEVSSAQDFWVLTECTARGCHFSEPDVADHLLRLLLAQLEYMHRRSGSHASGTMSAASAADHSAAT